MLAVCSVLLSIRRYRSVGGLELRIRMMVAVLLRFRHNDGSVGNWYIVCRLRPRVVETLVECVCRELFAESGTVQYRHGVVVDECNAVYAPLVGVAENNIYATAFQLGSKIVLAH